jgi:hypothetical protein
MSKNRNKRNTKKVKKKLNKKTQKTTQSKQQITLTSSQGQFPRLSKKIYNIHNSDEIFSDDVVDIKEVVSYKTLPKSIVKQIDNHIEKHPIRKSKCHVNSSLLSLNIEGVKTCRGWYSDNIFRWFELGKKHGNQEIVDSTNSIIDRIKIENSKGNPWVKLPCQSWSDEYEYWIETKTGDYWLHHSWNEYNGIYFDLSEEFQKKYRTKLDVSHSKIYKMKSQDDVKSITNNTELSEDMNKLRKVNSSFSGSGMYGLIEESQGYFVMNNNYKSTHSEYRMVS